MDSSMGIILTDAQEIYVCSNYAYCLIVDDENPLNRRFRFCGYVVLPGDSIVKCIALLSDS